MLTFLFALFAIWTLFWFVMLMLDWGDRTPFTNSKVLCATCAASNGGTSKATSQSNAKAKVSNTDQAKTSNSATASAKDVKPSAATNTDKAAANSANKSVGNAGKKATVTPLFKAPKEKDDLKIIKGIGVVMEKTLNDLGITTFAQLAGFNNSDVDMVAERLSESNSGFGDRITRDEWVGQAKVLAKKAA